MIETFNFIIMCLFLLCYLYQFIYIPIAWIKKPKPHGEVKLHRYAVLIAARNEEEVIENLISSIKSQDYPAELVDTYVVADNCTDRTAEIARKSGATVYERFNKTEVGKGYALNFLLEKLADEDSGKHYDAYIVFDADNVLAGNYITEMNKTFSGGDEIITSYRNTKNYGDNWISAGYGLWFLKDSQYLNYPRALLGTSCSVAGTGFLFSERIIKKCGGWNFFLLSEDIEFSIKNILDGEKIGYCPSAIFYDEQPTEVGQSWKQRLRWAKGYIQVFAGYGKELLSGILRGSFSCYDMTMSIMPAAILPGVSIIVNVAAALVNFMTQGDLLTLALSFLSLLQGLYLTVFALGLITTVTEWKKIYAPAAKKILYLFTFPIFMFMYLPIAITALFKKVEWAPIKHKKSMTCEEIKSGASK